MVSFKLTNRKIFQIIKPRFNQHNDCLNHASARTDAGRKKCQLLNYIAEAWVQAGVKVYKEVNATGRLFENTPLWTQ